MKSVTAGAGGIETWNFSPASGRYIRMAGMERNTQWGYSLYEFEVYGTLIKAVTMDPIVSQTPDEEVIYFPNPVSDQLTINLPGGNYTSLSVIDMKGHVVIQRALASETTTLQLDMDFLHPGIYVVRLLGATKIKTFVVSKR